MSRAGNRERSPQLGPRPLTPRVQRLQRLALGALLFGLLSFISATALHGASLIIAVSVFRPTEIQTSLIIVLRKNFGASLVPQL